MPSSFVLDVMREDSGKRFLRSDKGRAGRRGTGNSGDVSKEVAEVGTRGRARRRLHSFISGSVGE